MPTLTDIIWKTIVCPMRMTFATSLGSKTAATSVIVKVSGSDGSVGIGEIPTSFVFPHETVAAIDKILTQIRPSLLGKSAGRYAFLIDNLRKQWPAFAMTLSGLEVALFRASLAADGKRELAFWGAKTKTLQTDITIPFVPDKAAVEPWVKRAIRAGFTAYKIKVSGNVGIDFDFCRAIYHCLADSGKPFIMRLDGNQGFTPQSAMKLMDKLDRAQIPIELFEQPLKRSDYKGFKSLTCNSPVPIIADETVLTADDCKRVIDDRLAHGVNIKIAKSGISESRTILKLARQASLKLMLGCMTETMVGLSAAICCAAGMDAFDYIDLDSVHFLARRKRFGGICIDGSFYHVQPQ